MGRFRGGRCPTVVASVVFGGVSGSAVANASALGSILIPWQRSRLSGGALPANNATSAVIDILIPPSIPMILFALVSGVSVADLFTAGVLPPDHGGRLHRGLLVDFASAGLRLRGAVAGTPRADPPRPAQQPGLLMPVLILLGLRFGYATPTEIAVLTVIYSRAERILYQDLSWRRFYDAMIEAGVATGIVMLVIMGSAAVGWILTFDQVPVRFAAWVSTTLHEPILIILAMNVLMLLVGMPLDLPPAILLLGPSSSPWRPRSGSIRCSSA